MPIIELDCSIAQTNRHSKSSLRIVRDIAPESCVGTGFFDIEKYFIKVVFWNVDSGWTPQLVDYLDL